MSTIPNKVQVTRLKEPNLYVPPEPARTAPAPTPAPAPAPALAPALVRAVASPTTPRDSVSIVMPVQYEEDYASFWINGHLTGQEASILRGIRRALVKKGARLMSGQEVDTNIGTVRWMLQQAAKQVPPPASHGI